LETTSLTVYEGTDLSKHLPSKLVNELSSYLSKTKSTGCNNTDYCTLYKNIYDNKFKEIYEAGTGVSTLVMAYALYMVYKETGVKGRLTSMEEHKEYLDISKKLLPDYLQEYVDFILSDRVFDYWRWVGGYRYKDIPVRNYDFGWFDGPSTSMEDKTKIGTTANFDAVYLCIDRKLTIWGFVDGRVYTVYVLKELFFNKIKYYIDSKDKKCRLGIIEGIEYKDLHKYSKKIVNNVEKTVKRITKIVLD